ncbi:MAG: hypothetical protein U5J83_03300 [Bryobacterales bacterium]|nr:hypothetical protein [Bryobacterales bacterium]
MVKTTVVGSYPVPQWLLGNTSKLVLRDAIAVVLKTQELAGIDVVADGELNRFDPSHPETNGMIDYFVGQMSGIRTKFSLSDLDTFRGDEQLRYRSVPAGVVESALGEGTLNLPADHQFTKTLTHQPLKFTCTGPHMLTKVLTDRHYKDRGALAMDIAAVLRAQLSQIDAAVVQLDEANIVGHPEDRPWAADAINHVLDGIQKGSERAVHICFGNYGGQLCRRGYIAIDAVSQPVASGPPGAGICAAGLRRTGRIPRIAA